jgi:hypothetical protein
MEQQRLTIDDLREQAEQAAKSFELPQNWRFGRQAVDGFAIDCAAAKDIDDAIYVEPTDSGYDLTVSIADVGSFLSRQPAARRLARRAGHTHYEDGKAVRPMLPRTISEDVLSLKHKAERPVLSVHIPVDHQGTLGDATVYQDVITARRLSYQRVDKLLQDPPRKPTDELLAIQGLSRVARLLYEARHGTAGQSNYVFENDTPVRRDQEAISHGGFIVSQAMIAANESLAHYATRHDIPVLYRNVTLPESMTGLHEYELEQALIKDPTRALYATAIKGHDMLQVSAYLHGTSPLRRYADLVNHMNIAAYLDGRDYLYEDEKLEEIASMLNARASGMPAPTSRSFASGFVPLKSRASYLVERLQGDTVTDGDVASAVFRAIGSPEELAHVRQTAATYLARNPLFARQILSAAISRGDITLRASQPTDQTTTKMVLVDEKGRVYPYADKVKYRKFGSRKILEQREQVVSDIAILSSLIGLEIVPQLPATMIEVDAEPSTDSVQSLQPDANMSVDASSMPHSTAVAQAHVEAADTTTEDTTRHTTQGSSPSDRTKLSIAIRARVLAKRIVDIALPSRASNRP